MRFGNCFNLSSANRRRFLQGAAASTLLSMPLARATDTGQNVFGPRPGYSPQIGTLVSEMAWMPEAVLRATKGMAQDQLDFLLDDKANRMGHCFFISRQPRSSIN